MTIFPKFGSAIFFPFRQIIPDEFKTVINYQSNKHYICL